MKKLGLFGIALFTTVLTACALTPQQQAELAQEKAQKRLNFQVELAKQCDPVAAQLMAELPKISQLDAQARASFDQQYQARVNNATFQSCYKLAFQSYQEKQQLNLDQLEWDTNYGYFNNQPFNCEFNRPEGPFWGAC
jgi:rare lipoprotein A (peptidoglycan hydrolase)